MKRINNDYDSLAGRWWSEDEGATASIRYFVNPVRFAYFRKRMGGTGGRGCAGMKALDVGCGGGFLAEELSRVGLDVTGVDPSGESVRVAREHARGAGLGIDYRVARGEELPFGDGTFDMAFCCDVLEHVSDVNVVVSEIARVLKKGGLFFFDTINRTLFSRVAVIYFMQECGLTSFGRADGHVWGMFIKPRELRTIMSRNGMDLKEIRGISPARSGPSALIGMYRASRGKISYRALAERMGFGESGRVGGSYMGYGVKS